MSPKYVNVYNATSPTMAEAICIFLKTFEIPAFYRKEAGASAYGLYLDGFGGTKIFVPEEMAKAAQEILDQMDMGKFINEEITDASSNDSTQPED
jgi:hypothetical protein